MDLDNIHRATHWQAQSLYRCWLCCMNAYPSSLTQDKWATDAWNEACFRTDAHPNSLRRLEDEEACRVFVTCGTAAQLHSDFQIKCDSMKLLTDMKTKIKHAVDSSYEFETSRAPDSIGRNASRAQALLASTTFIYRVHLIVSYLKSLKSTKHMVHRISTLATSHVIHIDTP